MLKIFVVCVLVNLALAKPQLLSYKNGNFGVNFGGYHAEAGLGGLLTGNAADGGLQASAGTPYGQQAGAGLAGTAGGEGRTAGGGYAGASAGNGVGASAAFGGAVNSETGGSGGLGAEAHVPGKSTKVVQLGQTPGESATFVQTSNSNIGTRGEFSDNSATPVQTAHNQVVSAQPQGLIFTKQVQFVPYGQATTTNNAPSSSSVPNFNYQKFADFGYFSNLGSQFGGPHAATASSNQQTQPIFQKTVNIERSNPTTTTVQSNAQAPFPPPNNWWFYKQFTLPRPRPRFFSFKKSFRPFAWPRWSFNYGTGVVGGTNNQSSGSTNGSRAPDYQEVTSKGRTSVRRVNSVNAVSPSAGAVNTYSYTKTVPGPGLFDSIFNIPIQTLTAVNQFLNTKAQARGGFQKTYQVYRN